MAKILLSTLNAKHIHASLGLRYLYANMGELQPETAIREFTLEPWPVDIAERILADKPAIVGLGIYIWNREKSGQLVSLLKTVSPETIVVLGGPEVSHEWEGQQMVEQADYLITGQADLAFARLCQQLLEGNPPQEKVIQPAPPDLGEIASPYPFYTDEDIARRLVYVEASRGCPFKCEFCLSALDRTSVPFGLEPFLADMARLYERGCRHFKFVDRTFNLNPEQSVAILEFFLERMDERLFLHFEVIPDHLPDRLKEALQRFPAGSLQLEVGVQTFNPEVQRQISRNPDNGTSAANLAWLRRHTTAHSPADLIIGLPGEGMASFGESFDRLVALQPHEIQVGILKRLKGSPIVRHSQHHRMRYNPDPPFDILSSDCIDFPTMRRLSRFARYWEMIANSGRFPNTLPLLLGDAPFANFMQLSQWLHTTTGQVHGIALKRLFDLLYRGLTEALEIDPGQARETLETDFRRTGIKGLPDFLRGVKENSTGGGSKDSRRSRQSRH